MESKILITSRSFGQINDLPEKILKNAGYKVEYYNENFNEEEFARRVRGCEAIVIGGHKFSEEVLRECKDLKLICKHGAGVDNIPLKAAGELGIHVCNAPGTNADAVADHIGPFKKNISHTAIRETGAMENNDRKRRMS